MQAQEIIPQSFCDRAMARRGADLHTLEDRENVVISEADMRSAIEWAECWSNIPWFEPFYVGRDLRRKFGDKTGRELWLDLASIFREPQTQESLDREWASFDRGRRRDDELILDFLSEAAWQGWEPSSTLSAGLKRLAAVEDVFFEKEWKRESIIDAAELAEDEATDAAPAAQHQKLIQSGAEFIANFDAPEYLWDGVLQRRYCYSLTAQTGAGKTAIALTLAAHVALGRPLCGHEVQQGDVLYFASENYVDVQARVIALAQHLNFDVDKIRIHFVSGATKLSEIAEQITREVERSDLNLVLVVVDTSAATFEGDDENSNVDAIEHAKRMRSLTLLRGGPSVLVLCHPTKRAGADDLQPRGGGSFLAEIDGNLSARKEGKAVELHHTDKFRGPGFAPMTFELRTVEAQKLKDRRGRPMPTVLAAPLDEAGRQAMAVAGRRDEDQVLRAVETRPGASLADLAVSLRWTYGKDTRPHKMKVKRAIEALMTAKLVIEHRGAWQLSPKGQQELNRLDTCDGRTSLTPMPAPRRLM